MRTITITHSDANGYKLQTIDPHMCIVVQLYCPGTTTVTDTDISFISSTDP